MAFDFTLLPADWHHRRQHPKREEYVPAELRVGIEHFRGLGLRFKGGAGTLHSLQLDPEHLPKLSLRSTSAATAAAPSTV